MNKYFYRSNFHDDTQSIIKSYIENFTAFTIYLPSMVSFADFVCIPATRQTGNPFYETLLSTFKASLNTVK